MNKIVVLATLCSLFGYANAANAQGLGIVTGTVHDQKTGEELVGANVILAGTSLGASADLDGKFTIRSVPPGTYDVRISYIGYTPKVVQGIAVRADQTVTLDAVLAQVVAEAKEEVVVTAERVRSTEAAVLAERQKSATIGDAVSAEQIKRSPDATSSDALRRVAGVTVVDNKFVFVRGVTDRYNVTSLNGVSVTSTDTDVDRKSFSFDLVPANLLENTVVVKSATPDLPGDFSGGLVQVNTLDFPSARTARLQIASSYDGSTTTKEMLASQGGGRDWLGRDDGSRDLPPGNLTGNALARALPNNWKLQSEKAPFGGAGNLAFGDRMPVGSNELGYVGALSYRQGFQTSKVAQDRPDPTFKYTGRRFERGVLWGGLLNLNYKFRGLHKFSLKSNYNQAAVEKVNISSGFVDPSVPSDKQTISWNERSFYLSQLGGEHKVPALHALHAEWKGYYSESKAHEPDRKYAEYNHGPSGVVLGTNYRSWSELGEITRGAGADLDAMLAGTKVKFGGLGERHTRHYDIQAYTTDAATIGPPNYAIVALPIDKVFVADNYGQNRFRFIPVTTFTGAYDGSYTLHAGYGMVDRQAGLLSQRFRLIGGARVESARFDVRTVPFANAPPVPTRLNNTDWLPSGNLVWLAREDVNLRLAYGRSVNRPEFREMSDVLYYDFDREQNVQGNPNLQRARIDNYDVRAEWFPHVGEVLAVSYFYKKIDNAIEERLLPSPERYVRSWFNSPTGNNQGVELECRKGLGFLHPRLQAFSVTGNYTHIESAIHYTDVVPDGSGGAITTARDRVMQGQSPWSVNLSLLFVAVSHGTSMNLLYGKAGRRLDAVGDTRDRDVYEESRDMLEFAATQSFRSRWEAKLTAKNLLRESELKTQGLERSTFERLTREPVWALTLARSL